MSLSPEHVLSDASHAYLTAVFAAEHAIPPDPLATARWVVGLLEPEARRALAQRLIMSAALREELVTRRREWEAYARGETGDLAGSESVRAVWREAVDASVVALSPTQSVADRLARWGLWLRRTLPLTPPPTFAMARSAARLADAPNTLELRPDGTLFATSQRARSAVVPPRLEWRDPQGGGIDLGEASGDGRAWRWEIPQFGTFTGLRDDDLRPDLFRVRTAEAGPSGHLDVWSERADGARERLAILPLRDWPEVVDGTLLLPVTFPKGLTTSFAEGRLRVSLPVLDLDVTLAEIPVEVIGFGPDLVQIPVGKGKDGKITSASVVILTLVAR